MMAILAETYAKQPVHIFASVRNAAGELISSLNVSSVQYTVRQVLANKQRPTVTGFDPATVPATEAFLNNPITRAEDARVDRAGEFNFRHVVPRSAFPSAGTYEVSTLVALNSGEQKAFSVRVHAHAATAGASNEPSVDGPTTDPPVSFVYIAPEPVPSTTTGSETTDTVGDVSDPEETGVDTTISEPTPDPTDPVSDPPTNPIDIEERYMYPASSARTITLVGSQFWAFNATDDGRLRHWNISFLKGKRDEYDAQAGDGQMDVTDIRAGTPDLKPLFDTHIAWIQNNFPEQDLGSYYSLQRVWRIDDSAGKTVNLLREKQFPMSRPFYELAEDSMLQPATHYTGDPFMWRMDVEASRIRQAQIIREEYTNRKAWMNCKIIYLDNLLHPDEKSDGSAGTRDTVEDLAARIMQVAADLGMAVMCNVSSGSSRRWFDSSTADKDRWLRSWDGYSMETPLKNYEISQSEVMNYINGLRYMTARGFAINIIPNRIPLRGMRRSVITDISDNAGKIRITTATKNWLDKASQDLCMLVDVNPSVGPMYTGGSKFNGNNYSGTRRRLKATRVDDFTIDLDPALGDNSEIVGLSVAGGDFPTTANSELWWEHSNEDFCAGLILAARLDSSARVYQQSNPGELSYPIKQTSPGATSTVGYATGTPTAGAVDGNGDLEEFTVTLSSGNTLHCRPRLEDRIAWVD